MTRFGFALFAAVYSWIGPGHALGEQPMQGNAPHASRNLYPDAVISLRDPRSGQIFLVESNGRNLVALDRDGRVSWNVDIAADADIQPGQAPPVIRDLRLDGDELWVTLGKSETVKVEIGTGKARYLGSD